MADNMTPTASESEIADVRSKLEAVQTKAQSDSAFQERLKSEPMETLKAEGVPEKAIGEVLKHWKAEPEVEGQTIYWDCYAYSNYYEWYCTWYTS